MTVTPGRPSRAGRRGPSPTNVSVPSPSRPKAFASRTTFFRSISEPTQRKAGEGPGVRSSGRNRSRSTPQSTTSVFAAASGIDATSLPAQPLRDRDHRRGALHHPPGGWSDERILGQVRDVLPVGGDDQRCPRGESREQPREAGREEEVRVDDVRPEAPRGPHRTGGELRVAQLAAAAPVEHDPLDLVPARRQLALQALDEDAEVGRLGGGVHLRDEEDAHRRII